MCTFFKFSKIFQEAEDADDWDVDTSEYEQPGSGDKDARDASDMRRSNDFRSGRSNESVFKKPKSGKLGNFEHHTKGIGRKLMENSGWSDGKGLGSKGQGRPIIIDNKGQQGRFGLGYPKMDSASSKTWKKCPVKQNDTPVFHRVTKAPFYRDEEAEKVIKISTIFDENPNDERGAGMGRALPHPT